VAVHGVPSSNPAGVPLRGRPGPGGAGLRREVFPQSSMKRGKALEWVTTERAEPSPTHVLLPNRLPMGATPHPHCRFVLASVTPRSISPGKRRIKGCGSGIGNT
jgi:hypothetical protein